MTRTKISNVFHVIFSFWLSLSFLLGAVSPVVAYSETDRLFVQALSNDDIAQAIKSLAEQPLTSTPLRLRRLAVETLRPVASAQGGQNTLPLALVNRIAEDNAAYFFDEGRITHAAVLSHDRELAQRLMALLKDKRISSAAKQIYLQGLLYLVLADRHMAELAVQDTRIVIAGARQAGSLNQSELHQAEAHLNTAELRLRNGLEALRRGDADSAVQHFEKAWEFSARVQAIWSLTYNGDFDRDGVVDVVEMRLGSSPFAADTDQDGLSDAYELNFLIPHTLPNAADTDNDGLLDGDEDLDEDGLTNLAEQQSGTDPLVSEAMDGWELPAGSASPFVSDTNESGLADSSAWTLENALGMRNDEIAQGTPVAPAEAQEEPTPEPTPMPIQADTDADGLLDGDEVIVSGATVQILADPTRPDSDGDGVEDFLELRAWETPLQVFDPDSDDDGLSDGEEVNEYGTDPLGRDTDRDGVDDGAEVRQNADPLLATERMGALKATHEFVVGAVCGEFCINDPGHGNLAFFSGYLITGAISAIPGGVTQVIGLLADLRDFFAALLSGDWASLGLNTLALLPWVGDAADVPATIGKFLLKHADLIGEVGAFIARLDWLPESARTAGIIAAFGEEAFNALVNQGLDAAKLQRLSKAGVNLTRLNEALESLVQTYPGLMDYLRRLPAEAIDESTGILRVSGNAAAPGLTVNLKGLSAAQQAGDARRVASYLGNLKGAYTQWLARNERLVQGWRVIQEAPHVNAPGYDLVLAQGGVYRLVETKARARLALGDLHNYVRKHNITGELMFNVRYFTRNLTQANADELLRSGNFEIEFYLNGPESARQAQELLAQMGGSVARYRFEGVEHEVRIILTAVSQ